MRKDSRKSGREIREVQMEKKNQTEDSKGTAQIEEIIETPEVAEVPETVETLGEKLRRLRNQKGYAQKDVVEHLQVSRQMLSNWETGKFTPGEEILQKLSELYEVPLDDLIGTTEKEQEREPEEESQESCVSQPDQPSEMWQNEKRFRKLLLSCGIIIAVVLAVKIPFVGIAVSIGSLIACRKWELHSCWLYVIIFCCLGMELWNLAGMVTRGLGLDGEDLWINFNRVTF